MSKYLNPFPQHLDVDGNPCAFYTVYFGEPNQDPIANPKAPYSDRGLTVALSPTQTLNNTGLYQQDIYLDGAYSIRIETPLGSLFRETPYFEGMDISKLFDGFTVASMVADTSLQVGDYVTTVGYNSAGDKGDNYYQVVSGGSGTVDGGRFIDLDNGLQAKGLFPGGLFNVRQWGAVADGSTDDKDAIRSAMSFASGSSLYFPEGFYAVTVDSLEVFSPGGDTILYGDGINTVFQFNLIDIVTRTLFDISEAGVSFRDMRIRINDSFIGATIVGWAWKANRLSFRNVEVFGGVTGDISVSHLFQGIKPSENGSISDLEINNCYWHDLTRVWLRVNTDSSVINNVNIVNNRFERSESSTFAINSPNGFVDKVLFQSNLFVNPYIGVVQSDSFFIGPQANNVVIDSNVFRGDGKDAIHIEEASGNVVISNNVINMDAENGIFITDNDVSGSDIIPKRINITGNIIQRSDLTKTGDGIRLVNDASGVSPLEKSVISSNVIVGWADGIDNASESFDMVKITDNLIDGCTNGLNSNYGMPSFKDNYITNCDVGIATRIGGGMFGFTRFHSVTSKVVPDGGEVSLMGFGVDFNRNDFPATGFFDFPIMPATPENRANAIVTGHAYETNHNESIRTSELTWDGSTYTENNKFSVNQGQLTLSYVNTAGGLFARVSNSGALLTDGSFYLKFDGVAVYT